jgi:hypothetical protein
MSNRKCSVCRKKGWEKEASNHVCRCCRKTSAVKHLKSHKTVFGALRNLSMTEEELKHIGACQRPGGGFTPETFNETWESYLDRTLGNVKQSKILIRIKT